MGRFQREAITVDLNDPKGSVYQTEDDYSGLFYKFVPNKRIISAEEESFTR